MPKPKFTNHSCRIFPNVNFEVYSATIGTISKYPQFYSPINLFVLYVPPDARPVNSIAVSVLHNIIHQFFSKKHNSGMHLPLSKGCSNCIPGGHAGVKGGWKLIPGISLILIIIRFVSNHWGWVLCTFSGSTTTKTSCKTSSY